MSKHEIRRSAKPGECRAASEGIIEGYAAVWGTVDSYDSMFEKGAFAKTISERGQRIKLLWNHDSDTVIGRVTELREDEKGLFVRAQITMGVEKARDVFELIKDGAIDTFSFGFRTIKDEWGDKGIRLIKEVALYEVSPVTFEANPSAVITGTRSSIDDVCEQIRNGISDADAQRIAGLLDQRSAAKRTDDALQPTHNADKLISIIRNFSKGF